VLSEPVTPRIYCDTSLIVEYVLASGLEPEAEPLNPAFRETDFEKSQRAYVKELFRSAGNKLENLVRLRSIVGHHSTEAKMVVSPFVLLELDEFCAATKFKAVVGEVTGSKWLDRYDSKRVGPLIQKVYEDQEKGHDYAKQLWGALTAHGRGEDIAGIAIEPVKNLSLDGKVFRKVELLALMQMGMADITHVLAAASMGCTHIATMDEDFKRLRNVIEEAFPLKILHHAEVFQVVKSGPIPKWTSEEMAKFLDDEPLSPKIARLPRQGRHNPGS
jgi:hypothetical protein